MSCAQAQAAEGAKMAARLERAERAIEAERHSVRELQAALRAAQQVCPKPGLGFAAHEGCLVAGCSMCLCWPKQAR